MEKREGERQSEYDKLLSRYHELVRYHRGYLEKSKNLHLEISKVGQMDKFDLKSNRNTFFIIGL